MGTTHSAEGNANSPPGKKGKRWNEKQEKRKRMSLSSREIFMRLPCHDTGLGFKLRRTHKQAQAPLSVSALPRDIWGCLSLLTTGDLGVCGQDSNCGLGGTPQSHAGWAGPSTAEPLLSPSAKRAHLSSGLGRPGLQFQPLCSEDPFSKLRTVLYKDSVDKQFYFEWSEWWKG